MDNDFVQRLRILNEIYGWTYESLGNLLKVSKDTAGNYLRGKTPMPRTKVILLEKEVGIDANWLLTGNGTPPVELSPAENITLERKAKAGLSDIHHKQNYLREMIEKLVEGLVDELPPGTYKTWEVEGMSMYPSFSHGDKLACKRVSVDEIVNNRVYIIVVNNAELFEYRASGVWVKRLSHRASNGYITCRSDNKETAEPYPTFRVKTKELLEVWYPVARLTHNMSDPNRDLYDKYDELEGRIEMIESLLEEKNH